MACHRISWMILENIGNQISRSSMECHEISMNIMDYRGMSWNIMEYHGLSWNIMEYHGMSWKGQQAYSQIEGPTMGAKP